MRQIGAIIGIIALIFIGGLIIFAIPWGGGNKVEETKAKQLIEFADSDAEVVMSIRGRVNNNRQHRELRVSVSKDSVEATIFRGYEKTPLNNYDANNNSESFRVFLSALMNAGFTTKKPEDKNISLPGACSIGRLYEFDVIGEDLGEQVPESSWATSCRKKDGSFAGDLTSVTRLFEEQIVNFNDFTKGTEF